VFDLFLLTVPFGVIGAAMAWLISYDELSRRANRRTAKLEATRRAFTALVFLLMLGGIIALVVTRAHS
jgi:hypothetical protein